MDFRWFWCVLVLFFDIDIGLYSHSIGFPRFRMLLQKVLLLLPTFRFIEKKCRCRHQACQGDKKNIIALSSDATHGLSFSQRKGVSAAGLWESECNMDVSRIQGRHQREVQQNSSDLGGHCLGIWSTIKQLVTSHWVWMFGGCASHIPMA